MSDPIDSVTLPAAYEELTLVPGRSLFPLKGIGNGRRHEHAKAPATPNGKDDARFDADWVQGTTCYGLVLGPDELVIDIDRPKLPSKPQDGMDTFEGLPGYSEAWLDTRVVATPSKGLHLYYRLPPEWAGRIRKGKRIQGAKEIDVFSGMKDGYLVGAGSWTDKGEYRVVQDRPPALVPPELLAIVLEGAGGSSAGAGTGHVAHVKGAEPLDKTDLRRLRTRWRKHGEQGAAMASVMGMVLSGIPYADRGVVREVTRDFAYWLARDRPNLDPRVFASQLLEPCWMDMYAPYQSAEERGGKGIEGDWYRSWQSALDKIQSERAERAKKRTKAAQQRIYSARWGTTAEEYSPEQLNAMAEWLDIERELLPKHAVLQCSGQYWFLGLDKDGHPGYLGPEKPASVVERALDALAPFGGLVAVEEYCESKAGYKLVDRTDLVYRHGFTMGRVQGTFFGSSRVDIPEGRFVERLAPYAQIEGAWVDGIDRWLQDLSGGGERYVRLLDHISSCGDLSQAAPGLWITGSTGIGKSLVALGEAMLWGCRKAVNGNRLGNFNAGLRSCPVVEFAEKMDIGIDELKEMITSCVVDVEAKGVDSVPVLGALRIVLSSNNAASLKTKVELTEDDCAALEDRLIWIPSPARGNLLPREQAMAWLDGDLARHFRWLVDNHTPEPANRLACKPSAGGLRDQLLGGNTPLVEASRILLDVALGRQMVFEVGGVPAVFARGEYVYLSVGDLLTEKYRMGPKQFAQALGPAGYLSGAPMRLNGLRKRYSRLGRGDLERLCRIQDEDFDEVWGKLLAKDPGS